MIMISPFFWIFGGLIGFADLVGTLLDPQPQRRDDSFGGLFLLSAVIFFGVLAMDWFLGLFGLSFL